jgi:hypothetical protein
MFNLLADAFAGAGLPRAAVFEVHPGQLSRWLEEVWRVGPGNLALPPLGATPPFLGLPAGIVGVLDAPPAAGATFLGASGIDVMNPGNFTGVANPFVVNPVWHHLIYAYLLENTGAFEIMGEVVRRGSVGELLELQNLQAIQWLRATEELFFRDAPTFAISSVGSQLRPESRVTRRNAYWRMLGMDLSHPIAPRWSNPSLGAQPWKQDVGNGANTSFREKWSELLRQVWLGYENRNNGIGPNATDDAFLHLLCDSLRDMMNMRRRGGFLAREEFASAAAMSWFELTLLQDTPIVAALNCQAASASDRLEKIAQRVGMAPAPRARELFELAPLMSLLLRIIEANAFSTPALAALLYTPGTQLAETLNTIIDLWQSATGERVKDRPTGTVTALTSAQPVRIPGSQPLTLVRNTTPTGTGGR